MLTIFLALLLGWTFPREYTPPPTQFIVTYTMASGTSMQEMATGVSEPGACDEEPASPDTYCTAWPTCPAPGDVLFFWVQAVWEQERSDVDPSERLACVVTAACTCDPVPTDAATSTPDLSAMTTLTTQTTTLTQTLQQTEQSAGHLTLPAPHT